jgi:PAS domain S-box-containing protein
MNMPVQDDVQSASAKLFEAEEVCRALRSGEVDAVVVGSADEQKRVLLMSGAYARYRQIVEDMEQGAVTVTASGEILFANHAFAGMVGQSLLDVFRTPLARYVAQEHHGRLQTLLQSRLSTRENVVSLEGTGSPVRVSLVSSSDDFTTLLLTDVVQRQEVDEAMDTLEAIRRGAVDAFVVGDEQVVLLENAQSPYRAVVEHMHEGAALLDDEGQIVYANEQFLSMLGAPLATLRGKALLSFVPVRDRGALQSLLDARDTAHADLRLNRANGDILAMHVTTTRLDGQRLMLFRDTTLQKRHQAADERTRKFLGMLAHEFRNILAPISSSTQYLSQVKTLDAQSRKAVETIARQSERLLGLVEDLRRVNPPE